MTELLKRWRRHAYLILANRPLFTESQISLAERFIVQHG